MGCFCSHLAQPPSFPAFHPRSLKIQILPVFFFRSLHFFWELCCHFHFVLPFQFLRLTYAYFCFILDFFVVVVVKSIRGSLCLSSSYNWPNGCPNNNLNMGCYFVLYIFSKNKQHSPSLAILGSLRQQRWCRCSK